MDTETEKKTKFDSLGLIVSRRASKGIKRVVTITAFIAIVIIICLLLNSIQNNCVDTAKLYSAQVENAMEEKASFIETVASGVNSGAVGSDKYYDYVDTLVSQYENVSAVYVCVPDPKSTYSDGIYTYMSGGWVPPADFVVTEREWYKGAIENDGLYISEPYVDEQSGEICITLSHKVDTEYGEGCVGMDMYMSDLVSLAESSYSNNSYISIISDGGTILTHPNENYALTTANSTLVSDTPYNRAVEHSGKTVRFFDYSGGLKTACSIKSEMLNWNIVYVNSMLSMIFLILVFVAVTVAVTFISAKLSSASLTRAINPMFKPLEGVSSNVSNITEGNLDFRFNVDDQSSEVHEVTNSLNSTIEGLRYYIQEIIAVVGSIADKNLSFEVSGEFKGDYKKIKDSLENILGVLNVSLAEINKQADAVKEYSDNLAQTSESVAESATNQSHSIAEANTEMESLAKSINDIVELANAVEKNANDTNKRLTVGGQEMESLVKAMGDIVDCFDGIAAFVSEINEIAAQTNLLSLNASIEAARAGEAGRGFAVVAGEIQNLSINSSNASNSIQEMIEKSRIAVSNGKELAERTRTTISAGIEYSVENAKNVHKIVDAVDIQKVSVEEISESFKDISGMVEGNAAAAEENSAISVQLGNCAKMLSDTVNEFKLRQ